MSETTGFPAGSGRDANLAATVDPTMESVMERVRTRWDAAGGLRVDDPFARRGMAALSEALCEATEFIEANLGMTAAATSPGDTLRSARHRIDVIAQYAGTEPTVDDLEALANLAGELVTENERLQAVRDDLRLLVSFAYTEAPALTLAGIGVKERVRRLNRYRDLLDGALASLRNGTR